MDIGEGDWVECIDVSVRDPRHAPPFLCLGQLYLVKKVTMHPTYGPLLVLHGVIRSIVGGYCADRFKPVYRPKPKAFDVYLDADMREPA